MINLITSFFIPKEVERQNEILKCLYLNNRLILDISKKFICCIEKKEPILIFLKEKIKPKRKNTANFIV